jgi:hypothetical protein
MHETLRKIAMSLIALWELTAIEGRRRVRFQIGSETLMVSVRQSSITIPAVSYGTSPEAVRYNDIITLVAHCNAMVERHRVWLGNLPNSPEFRRNLPIECIGCMFIRRQADCYLALRGTRVRKGP